MTIFGLGNSAAMLPATQFGGQLQPISFQPQGPLYGIGALPGTAGVVGEPSGTRNASLAARLLGQAPDGSNRFTRAIKAALLELGFYKGPVNTVYDEGVRKSVLAYQRKRNLKATGRPNARTRRHLQQDIRRQAALRRQAAGSQLATSTVLRGTAQGQLPPNAQGQLPMFAGQGQLPMNGLQPGLGATGLGTGANALFPNGLVSNGMAGAGMLPFTGMPGIEQPTGPQLNATNQQGIANGTDGADQQVTNRNVNDGLTESRSPWMGGWGSPYGGFGSPAGYGYGAPGLIGWNTPGYGVGTLGMANPYTQPNPYTAPGASMTGAWYASPQNQGGIRSFFSRLFS